MFNDNVWPEKPFCANILTLTTKMSLVRKSQMRTSIQQLPNLASLVASPLPLPLPHSISHTPHLVQTATQVCAVIGTIYS